MSIQMMSPHTFQIPVMGTGFTIDTPVYVARYGISSVISLVDDELIEQMRQYHCQKSGYEYEPITLKTTDFRAKRIAAYLDLLDDIVKRQIEHVQKLDFNSENDLTLYFDLLPECKLKQDYFEMKSTNDKDLRERLQIELRKQVIAGSIDVNIMTKLNSAEYRAHCSDDPLMNHAIAALRGFVRSKVNSAVILSAGLNPQLFSYMAEFDEFIPDDFGNMKKKIVLKVSDYRSAIVQGKILAKKGLWVSEYRIESGLNCGGHAFATKGILLGPILDEFNQNRNSLCESLFTVYQKALNTLGKADIESPPKIRVTVQGGIGTAEEQTFLLNYYNIDMTGWGTPFLLVPEATNVDLASLEKLKASTKDDVYLSGSSPLGIPFWNLRTSVSELSRLQRIEKEKPGTSCPKGFLRANSDFTKNPICTASRIYQKNKLEEISESDSLNGTREHMKNTVLEKSCICHDLSGGVLLKNNITDKATPAICCGPNIINFDRIYSLKEMIDHIYGRINLITHPDRPHLFIRELQLYHDYFKQEISKISAGTSPNNPAYLKEFKENLLLGIQYYNSMVHHISKSMQQQFSHALHSIESEIQAISFYEDLELIAN